MNADAFSSAAVTPGTVIGSYSVERLLGQGGMGAVYLARDTRLNRMVAIKVLADRFGDDSARRRFQREAQTASSLNHPHLLTVHDIIEHDHQTYLITEFVDGGTLRDWVTRTKPTWRQVIELLLGVADGLAAAHAAGVVHRDIKPENILIAKNGYAKLGDFGLAKTIASDTVPAQTQNVTAPATQSGLVIGTVPYMSPEQALGRPVDARSDVFSFGIVLHELLSGRRPFAAESHIDELQRIVRADPDPLDASVPAPLQAIVAKALEKEPADRYQSMTEMVVDLRRVLRRSELLDPAMVPTTHPPRRARRIAVLAAVAVAVLVAGGAAAWYSRAGSASDAAIRSIAVLPFQNLSRDPDQEFFTDGTTESLIANLARVQAIGVISRTTVMRYKGSTKPLRDIASELGVDAIVEGSVQRLGDRVRVSAQLIRAASNDHVVWAEEYERGASDFLRLEADVAKAIAESIAARITPEEAATLAAAPSVDPEVLDAYLMGRHQLTRGSAASFKEAATYFQQAIDRGPTFAPAFAGLSNARQLLDALEPQSSEAMRDPAERAVALDANLGEAHDALAGVEAGEWRWTEAEREYRRARQLNPRDAEMCGCFGFFLAVLGRFDEAFGLLDEAVRLNPMSAQVHANYATAAIIARRYPSAVEHGERSLALEPENVYARIFLSGAYLGVGRTQDAIRVLERPPFEQSAYLASAYAAAGRRTEAQKLIDRIVMNGGGNSFVALARAYAALGDVDHAVTWLQKAIPRREAALRSIPGSPEFDGIRDDPRFKAVVATIGIPFKK
jgi:serine/threonine protein kinase/Flp pilus assembly protein TadD